VQRPVQLPLQYSGVFSDADEIKGKLETTTAPSMGKTIPAAFLKNPRRVIISLVLFISFID
jgi:hypothetical protein